MTRNSPRRWFYGICAILVLLLVAGAGWWAGMHSASLPNDPTDTLAAPAPTEQTPDSAPAAPAAGSGTAEAFAVLECTARLYDDAQALAVTFTQPLRAGQNLNALFQAMDHGAVPATRPAVDDTDASPAVVRPAPGKPVAGEWVLGENPRVAYLPYLQPNRHYRVAIAADVLAHDGARLPGTESCEVDTPAMPPAYFFASRGVVLPPGQNGGLPITTVNVPEVDVQFLRIAPEHVPYFYETVLRVRAQATADEAAAQTDENDPWRWAGNRSLQGSVGLYDLDNLSRITQSVFSARFLAGAEPDRRHTTFLPVEDIAELQAPGIYVAVMSQPGRFNYESQVTYFYVSDLGVHAHLRPQALDVFVTSLTSAHALEGIEVDLLDARGKRVTTVRTDALGQASFANPPREARLVVARRGTEQTLMSLAQPALDLSEFAATGHAAGANRLYAYAGRDLYRPGETFTVSVLQRGADGQPLPAAPLNAVLKRPDGRTVRSEVWQPHDQAPGYLQQQITLAADAPTGSWLLELRRDPGARVPDTTWRFQVEEFVPERMALRLLEPPATLRVGEPLELHLQADHLYGAPAAGNRLLGTLTVERARVPLPEALPGFIFGDVADDQRRQWQELPEQVTDEHGAARVEVPLALAGTQSPMRVRTRFSLLESGARPVVRAHDTLVWPADVLVGVRPLFASDVTRQGAPAEFEIVRARADGSVVAGGQAAVRLFRERRDYYWSSDDQSGWNSGYTESDELVEARTLPLAERTRLTLPLDWGRYRLEVIDPDSGRVLRYRFHAGWDAQDAEALGHRPDRVQLHLQTPADPSARTLQVRAVPPHDGEALVTLEGGGVLWTARLPVKAGGTTLEIPLRAEWQRQDLYLTVIAFRPGAQGEARVTPARAVGLLHIPLAREDRRLEVAIKAAARTRPEQRQSVQVQVAGIPAGETAWVTLSAVDLGILNITDYASPDPFDFFFGRQRYGAQMLDMYGRLIEAMQGRPGRLKWGGDGIGREREPLPPRVRLVDLFSGPVAVDAQGHASIELDLPDFNGTLRLMATAFTAQHFGSSQAELVVAAPIVAELGTPRFLNDGDHSTLVLDVTNLSGQARELAVELQADAPLTVADGARTLSLADGERRTLQFAVQARGVGQALLMLRVQAAGKQPERLPTIERRSVLAVAPATPLRQQIVRGRLEPGALASASPDWFAGLERDGLQLSLSADARVPLAIASLVQELLAYPYRCSEQTVSSTYPYLLLDAAQMQPLSLEELTPAQRTQRVAAAIGRLAGMQAASGAFSLWGDARQDVWLTAYVTGFLQDARQAGHAVPAGVLERATEWLQARLREGPSRFATLPERLARPDDGTTYAEADARLLADAHQRFAALALAGYVLAREQQAPLASLRELYERQAAQARSVLPLVHLAAALRLMGDMPRSQAALAAGLARPYGLPGAFNTDWLGDYGSLIRDNALAYSLMHQHGLEHPGREGLLLEAAQAAGNRPQLSTQEQLALLQAWQAAQAGAGSADWQLQVSAPGLRQTLAADGTRTLSLDAHQAARAQLANLGPGPLFYEVRSQGHMPGPVQAARQGASVQAEWFHPDGSRWQGGPVATGQTLVVKLQVQAEHPIETGLLVQRIPAGFELENRNLYPGDAMLDVSFDGTSLSEVADEPAISHQEWRDDRFVAGLRVPAGAEPLVLFYRLQAINPGNYAMPPAVLEDMYRPQIFGISDSGQITIEPVQNRAARP